MVVCLHTKPVTLITGATGGMGTALALALTGHDLILTGRDPKKLEALCSSIPSAKSVLLELQKPETFATALEQFPWIDNLIHNAGMVELGSVEEMNLEVWRDTLNVNLLACVELTRVCLSRLRESRGQVLFVNSGAGLNANANWGAYAASKFALRAFADALSAEESSNGIRVMTVYPGRTATKMQEKVRTQEHANYESEKYIQPKTLASTIKTMLETPRDSILTQVVMNRAF
jgi:NADP-dependent 3-hydroxy acid dehydrogenase YdfG